MYASKTRVSPDRSRAELDKLLRKYGAKETSMFTSDTVAAVSFVANGRRVRFNLQLTDGMDAPPSQKKRRYSHKLRGYVPAVARMDKWADQENARRWRALLLCIKAKLEAVQSGIETFDEAFLAHVVVGQRTVYEELTAKGGKGVLALPAVKS